MLQTFRNAFVLPDLRKRILFTLGILVLYQLAAHVPVPGVNQDALNSLLQGQGAASALANILNLLSGGAISSFSVLAMGVYPYITAQIILQLLAGVVPSLERMLREEGTAGRQKLETYTFILTIPMALLSAIGQIRIFSSSAQGEIIPGFGSQFLPTVAVLATMTAGTFFAIWLGQLITEEGVGQGISIIIFGGIVARIPSNIGQILSDQQHALGGIIAFAIVVVLTVAVIVYVQEGERRVPVQYGKRVRGRRVFGGGATFIPIKVNMAGMIPLIFAQSLLVLPAILFQVLAGAFTDPSLSTFFTNLAAAFSGGRHELSWIYWLMMFLFVVGFTFFYTDVLMQQQNMAETLQKQGGFIPGIRPGGRTEEYIMAVSRRITLVGALFLGAIAVLPFFLTLFDIIPNAMNMSILSTGLLIVVGVVLDTIRQLEAQLTMRHYEGFLR